MIAVGVAIYVPFLRLNNRLVVRNSKEEMDGLISFIREKEKLIIDMTVSSIAEVSKECGPDFRLSMNLTAKSLFWDVDKYIDKTLKKYNVKPLQLRIEITEQDVLSKATMVIEKMNHLKDQGHVMMIDDFGMGQYNS